MRTFNKKTALITGSTSGIGLAIAKEMASTVANLILVYRNESKYNSTIEQLSSCGVKVSGIKCDLSKDEEVSSLLKELVNVDVDILVNNAGVFPIKNILESTEGDYVECFNVNIKAPFLLSNHVAKKMIKKKWGRIINIGSSSCYAGSADTGLYCSSKHALLGLSRSLYKELKQHNIRVYNVSPGSTQTKMGATDTRQDFATFITPQEVAKYVCFVASFDSEGISEEIRINRMVIR